MKMEEKTCICSWFLSDFNNTLFIMWKVKSIKEAIDEVDVQLCIGIVIDIMLWLSYLKNHVVLSWTTFQVSIEEFLKTIWLVKPLIDKTSLMLTLWKFMSTQWSLRWRTWRNTKTLLITIICYIITNLWSTYLLLTRHFIITLHQGFHYNMETAGNKPWSIKSLLNVCWVLYLNGHH